MHKSQENIENKFEGGNKMQNIGELIRGLIREVVVEELQNALRPIEPIENIVPAEEKEIEIPAVEENFAPLEVAPVVTEEVVPTEEIVSPAEEIAPVVAEPIAVSIDSTPAVVTEPTAEVVGEVIVAAEPVAIVAEEVQAVSENIETSEGTVGTAEVVTEQL